MPSNEELIAMEGVGYHIQVMSCGWRTTIVRRDPEYGSLHEETYPTRTRFRSAREDAARSAPAVKLEEWDTFTRWRIAACAGRRLALIVGVQIPQTERAA